MCNISCKYLPFSKQDWVAGSPPGHWEEDLNPAQLIGKQISLLSMTLAKWLEENESMLGAYLLAHP